MSSSITNGSAEIGKIDNAKNPITLDDCVKIQKCSNFLSRTWTQLKLKVIDQKGWITTQKINTLLDTLTKEQIEPIKKEANDKYQDLLNKNKKFYNPKELEFLKNLSQAFTSQAPRYNKKEQK